MTNETFENLSNYIGDKKIPNSLWIDFISESFGVSRSVAKQMLHAMYEVKRLKTLTWLMEEIK